MPDAKLISVFPVADGVEDRTFMVHGLEPAPWYYLMPPRVVRVVRVVVSRNPRPTGLIDHGRRKYERGLLVVDLAGLHEKVITEALAVGFGCFDPPTLERWAEDDILFPADAVLGQPTDPVSWKFSRSSVRPGAATIVPGAPGRRVREPARVAAVEFVDAAEFDRQCEHLWNRRDV